MLKQHTVHGLQISMLSILSRVDWFKSFDLNQWFKSSNKNHDLNQAIKILKKSSRFKPVCDVYDTFI